MFEEALENVRHSYRLCVYGYVVMPEHVHLLLSEPERSTVAQAIKALKQSVSRRLIANAYAFWQKRYYDHNVRSYESFVTKLRYIHRNPVKRGLCEAPENWEWSSFRHYVTGVEGVVQIESQWTASRRERAGFVLRRCEKPHSSNPGLSGPPADSSAPATISEGGKKATLQLGPNSPGKVKVKGLKVSKNADNIKIAVMNKKGQALPPGQKFSVVWVTINSRQGNEMQPMGDNSAGDRYGRSFPRLGAFAASSGYPMGCNVGIEFTGKVTPDHYAGLVVLRRKRLHLKLWDSVDWLQPVEAWEYPDDSEDLARDDDPQSGGSKGNVYDLDAPGIRKMPYLPDPDTPRTLRYRENFREFAVLDNKSNGTPVSDNFDWYAVVSCTFTTEGNVVVDQSYPNDNQAGKGSSTLSLTLQ